MKVSGAFEQGVYVVAILALERDHAPVKSRVMSRLLQVSDSYLKKLLMTMARNGLIEANASRQGGYRLARSVEEITLLDVYDALGLDLGYQVTPNFAERLFPDAEHARRSEMLIEETLRRAADGFRAELATVAISDLLEDDAYRNGAIDWERVAAE